MISRYTEEDIKDVQLRCGYRHLRRSDKSGVGKKLIIVAGLLGLLGAVQLSPQVSDFASGEIRSISYDFYNCYQFFQSWSNPMYNQHRDNSP